MKSMFLPLLLALLTPMLVRGVDRDEKTKAADIENIKKIGEAIAAFKKAKGDYPGHLHELVPEFLPDAKVLVSPLGVEADPRAVKREYDPKYPCTYCYEFSAEPFYQTGKTFREIKTVQLEEYGPTIPILRCFLYEKALNLGVGGDLYETQFNWEWDAETQRLMKKNGLGPGAQHGKKLVITLTDDSGKPLPGVALGTQGRSASGLIFPPRDFSADADGKVTIPLGTDPKPRVNLRCNSGQWFLAARSWQFGDEGTPESGEIAKLSLAVNPAASTGGTVRDRDGTPLAQAAVTAYIIRDPGVHDYRGILTETKTDEHGQWKLSGVPKKGATVLFSIRKPGHRTFQVQFAESSVPAAAELFAEHADVRLLAPFPVKGTVSFGNKPVPKAKVYLRSRFDEVMLQGETDATGQFEVQASDEMSFGIAVVASDLAPYSGTVDVSATGQPLEVVMDAGKRIQGRLVRGQNIGVPHVSILYQGSSGGPGLTLPEKPVIAVTDEQGRFTWEHAPKLMSICSALLPDSDPYEFWLDPNKNGESVIKLGR